ncbi:DnaJ- protein scj1 [Kappamyces sp. JEL0680]|nr:DnaJ- protein scj1 [Kappamyces sp. JEL0680]
MSAKAAEYKLCDNKYGAGSHQQFAPGIYQQMQTTCQTCGGKGKIVKEKCPVCKGDKVRRGSHQLTIYIERGMEDGTRIEFEGESDQSPDTQAGDVVFVLKQKSHPVFERQGALNLVMKHTISLKDALLGFTTTVKHMDGSDITLSRDRVTQNGMISRIVGQGMPKHLYPDERGDLFVEYQVAMPASLSEDQKKVLASVLGDGDAKSNK